MRLEKDLMLQVKSYLSNREITGEVLWFGRLNSLRVKTIFGGIVQGCPAGTPDIVSIVRSHNNYIICLFLELKSEKGRMRLEQKNFIRKYGNKKGIYILILRNIEDLKEWFNINAYDFVKDISI